MNGTPKPFTPEYFEWMMNDEFVRTREFYRGRIGRNFQNSFRHSGFCQKVFQNDGELVGCCSDSRVLVSEWLGWRTQYIVGAPSAGSLLLLDNQDPDAAHQFIAKSGIQWVYPHSACGAGKLLFSEKMGRPPESLDELDRFVVRKTRALARRHGIRCGKLIPFGDLSTPCDVHPVRTVAYVGVPAYAPHRSDAFPNSFRVSRIFHTRQHASEETHLFTSLILGSKGFGPRVTKKNPVVWLVVGNADVEEFSRDALIDELRRFRRGLDSSIRERVYINGFNWSAQENRIV